MAVRLLVLLFVAFSRRNISIRRLHWGGVQRTELIERLFCAQSEGAAAAAGRFLAR